MLNLTSWAGSTPDSIGATLIYAPPKKRWGPLCFNALSLPAAVFGLFPFSFSLCGRKGIII